MIAFFEKIGTEKLSFQGPILLVYGMGEEINSSSLNQWLLEDQERKVFFLEDDAETFSRWEARLNQDPLHEKKEGRFWSSFPELDLLLREWAWQFLFQEVGMTAISARRKKNPDKVDYLEKRWIYWQRGVSVLLAHGKDGFYRLAENLYSFYQQTIEIFPVRNLFQQFQGIPAIICGAGPALSSQLPLLKTLQEKALLLAGGSTLNVLSECGLHPHFVAHVDRESPYERFKGQTIWEVPFFCTSTMSKENVPWIQAPLWVAPSQDLEKYDRWFASQLDIDLLSFPSGWCVTTFLTALAQAFGCNPIFFVGMNFSFSGEECYAKGLQKREEREKNYALTKERDGQGQEVWTQEDWWISARWLEIFARSHPETQFFQSSGDGLPLGGIESLPLSEAHERYLEKSFDLQGLVFAKTRNSPPLQWTRERGKARIEQMKESIASCEKKIQQLFFEQGISTELEWKKREGELSSYCEEEPFFQCILAPLWEIWEPLWKKEVEKEKNPLSPELRLKLHRWVFFQEIILKHQQLLSTCRGPYDE